jgi:hypothetical protein
MSLVGIDICSESERHAEWALFRIRARSNRIALDAHYVRGSRHILLVEASWARAFKKSALAQLPLRDRPVKHFPIFTWVSETATKAVRSAGAHSPSGGRGAFARPRSVFVKSRDRYEITEITQPIRPLDAPGNPHAAAKPFRLWTQPPRRDRLFLPSGGLKSS